MAQARPAQPQYPDTTMPKVGDFPSLTPSDARDAKRPVPEPDR